MTYRPDIPEFPEDASPEEAHRIFEEITNMSAAEGRELRETERHQRYLETASGGREESDPPIPGGPLGDAIHLAETPADEWGQDEIAEAREHRNYAARTLPQFGADEGEPLLPERQPDVHKGELALQRWLIDPEPEDEFP